MANSINSVTLVGRPTKDFELRTTSNGTPYCLFTLAVDNPYSQEGKASFIPCIAWRHSANFLTKYGHKGQLMSVEGMIETQSYKNKEGQNRFVTQVLARRVQLLQRIDDNKVAKPKQQNPLEGYVPQEVYTPAHESSFDGVAISDFFDNSDLPF